MTQTSNSLFVGFQPFAQPEVPAGKIALQYGIQVKVVQIEGTVELDASNVATLRELARQYAITLNMPVDVELHAYDGERELPLDQPIPAEVKRVEFRQPGSEHGNGRPTFMLPLEDADSVRIEIAREDTYLYTMNVVDGKMSSSLLSCVTLSAGHEITGVDSLMVIVTHRKVAASRKALRTEATANRRIAGGAVESEALTVNDVLTLHNDYLRVILNGEEFVGCRKLEAGETLIVVKPGKEILVDFAKVFTRLADLKAKNWAMLRAAGIQAGVKVAGAGRNAAAIMTDIIKKEFASELPDEEKFIAELINS